jgi:tetratricopeptide (TPR) repeat protein
MYWLLDLRFVSLILKRQKASKVYMKKLVLLFIIISSLNSCCVQAQESQQTIDSLLNVLQRLSSPSPEIELVTGSDTVKVIVLNRLGRHYRMTNNYDQALKYLNEAKTIAHKVEYLRGEAHAIGNIGIINEYKGNYDSALFFLENARKIREVLGDKRGIASSNHSMGVVYVKLGNYEKAMTFYIKALKTLEELGDKKAVGTSYNNIGNIFLKQNNYKKALENYQNSLKIQLEVGNQEGLSLVYGNLASVYLKLEKYNEALDADFKCLKICKEIEDKEGVAICYNNIGLIYELRGDYSLALDYQFKSLEIVVNTGNRELIATVYNSIGGLYQKQKQYANSLKYNNKALEIFKNIGNKEGIQNTYSSLSELYENLGNYELALTFHKLYIDIKDTLLNELSNKQIAEMNTKYESEKKEKDIQLLTKDKKLQVAEIGKQKLIKNLFIIGFAVAIIIAFIVLRLFKATKKQKIIIEHQNEQIFESITYSKRIQNSLLPSLAEMKENIPSLFVLYEPKNIVSGDFYYFKQFEKYSVLACVDCTGHGVPGGFMSTLGSLLLDKIVNDTTLKPSEILIQLNNEIIRILHQQAGGELQDGMDLSVCLIDRRNSNIEYSGARNGIIVVTRNEAKRYKANPLPVGGNYIKKGIPVERNFKTESIALNNSDWVFMYTDGFIEQIGGKENQPMNYEQFEKHLVNTTRLNTDEEKIALLQSELTKWSGNNEQTDDVLIVGFKIA